MKQLFVHQDIREASTLSSEFYTSDRYFEISKEKIFSRSWQFIGNTDELRLSGQIIPHNLFPEFINEPIVVLRDLKDNLQCLSNVCTHRGNILIENSCVENQIRCRYHGRRFNLDGTFKQMPEFEEVKNFPTEKDNLSKVPLALWEKLMFVSINPVMELEALIGEMKRRMNFLPLKHLNIAPVLSRDYLVKAHWALYCENYLEGFHIPFIHNSLNSIIDYDSYTTELYKYSSLQLALSKGGDNVFDLPVNSPEKHKNISAFYYWLFPNMMFNFYPWGLSINIVKPINKGLTKVSFITYMYNEAKIEQGASALLDKIEREDEAIVENVQRGIRSRYYDIGRYAPKRETGTHQFHRLICEFMNQ